jgi:hypothetical protein
MQTTDFHQRYWHPHYVLAVKLFVQADGSIVAIQGNVKLELSNSELEAMIKGIKDLARVYAVLHSGDTRTVVQG